MGSAKTTDDQDAKSVPRSVRKEQAEREDSIAKLDPERLPRNILEQLAQSDGSAANKALPFVEDDLDNLAEHQGESMSEEDNLQERQPERLSGDILAQIEQIEEPVAHKVVRAGLLKRKPKKPAPAVWTSRNLHLQVVELKRPAPVSEKARRFRDESVFGGRIRRMPVAAYVGLQRKKAVRRIKK